MQFASARNKIFGWLFVLSLLIGLDRCLAANTSLIWDPSPDASVVGYNIYFGTASGSYSNKITLGNVTSVTISNLESGVTYYFAATAFDANGLESDYSNEFQLIVPGILTLSQGLNPGDPMLIKFPVEPDHWYEVQATTDLNSWTTIWQTELETTNDWVQFTDLHACEFSSRFYRLVLH